jgi:hypothetical protein
VADERLEPTGHADHFLSRLDRLERPLVELALSLYNDVPLLRHILQLARVPEQVERVALSLGDPVEGPFLLVTREGRFVTCLGPGMSPGSLPIVTRRQLDTIAEKAEDLRRRMAEAERQGGENTDRFLARIYDVGAWLSREEMLGLSSFAPVLSIHLLSQYIEIEGKLMRIRGSTPSRRVRRKISDEMLHSFHLLLWGAAHLLVLVGAGARRSIEAMEPPVRAKIAAVLTDAFNVFDLPFTKLRSIWVAGRLAKVLFPSYKQQLAETDHPTEMRLLAMGLTTMALRHRAFEVDVRRALVRHRFAQIAAEAPPEEVVWANYGLKAAEIVSRLCLERLDEPARGMQLMREVGHQIYARLLRRRSPRAIPLKSVPDEVSFAAVVCAGPPLITEDDWVQLGCVTPPFLAAARPEDLYLPAAAIEQLRVPWSPAESLPLLEPLDKPETVVHAQTIPGRNDACSCGSGKKYKKCCG